MGRAKLHPTDDRVRQTLKWLRAERIIVSRVSIGDVELELVDTHLTAKLAEPRVKDGPEPTEQDLFKRYAGGLLDGDGGPESPLTGAMENMHAEEDDDE